MNAADREFAYCPNCGARSYWPEVIQLVKERPGDSGCGACAQATVRPRSLYRWLLGTTFFDSDPGTESIAQTATNTPHDPSSGVPLVMTREQAAELQIAPEIRILAAQAEIARRDSRTT